MKLAPDQLAFIEQWAAEAIFETRKTGSDHLHTDRFLKYTEDTYERHIELGLLCLSRLTEIISLKEPKFLVSLSVRLVDHPSMTDAIPESLVEITRQIDPYEPPAIYLRTTEALGAVRQTFEKYSRPLYFSLNSNTKEMHVRFNACRNNRPGNIDDTYERFIEVEILAPE